MTIRKIFNPKFYIFEKEKYRYYSEIDERFNATFRNGNESAVLSKQDKRAIEYRFVKMYRKYQANINNIWGKYYRKRLQQICKKTGIDFMGNANIGRGLIIGHWGRIVINNSAKFGDEIMLTHNVTIGRDIRGKRAGAPTFGSRICIRTNSTVVGNITIGDDVLIAPNTFVNFDVPSHSIVIGNPAKIIHKENATEGHIGKGFK